MFGVKHIAPLGLSTIMYELWCLWWWLFPLLCMFLCFFWWGHHEHGSQHEGIKKLREEIRALREELEKKG